MDSPDVVGDVVIQVPHVRRRHRDVIGEATVAIDANDFGEGTDVRVSSSAEQAATVDYVPLRSDAVSFLHIGDEPADLNHIAGELVPDDEGRLASTLRPCVPVVDVHVGAADSRAPDTNENFVFTNPGLLDVLQFETGCRGFLYQRFQELLLR